MVSYQKEETEPLVTTGESRGSSPSGSAGGGFFPGMCTRIVLASLLLALIALSAAFNYQMRSLGRQISAEEVRIEHLQSDVDAQAGVIQRFSDSVTNSDVLARVNRLEDHLTESERDMRDRLDATEDRIANLLNSTLNTLNTIVNNAQTEIHEEVDRVKTDVDVYVRTTQDQFSMENSFMIYQLAGTFTLLACLISMWHMTAHLRKFRQPYVQRKILAILWMSPLYGITSWLSLVWPVFEGYLAVVKDFYEAYVIYQFLSFLIAILGRGDRGAVVDLLAGHADHLEPPFRLCGKCCPRQYDSPRAMADEVLLQCQTFAMQFVFCRPLTTIGIFVCNKVEYFGRRGESATDYRSPQFWFLMVQNVSVFVAFSGLLKFYHAVQDDLAWCRPFPKFLCIKGIVFMTFWQGLAIAILARTTENAPVTGAASDGDEDPDIWAKQAQNFLICLEMLLFSIAHFYCFPTEEWEEGYRPRENPDARFGDNIALRDFFSDLKLIVSQGGKKKKRRKSSKKSKTEPSTPPDDDKEGNGDGGTAAASLGEDDEEEEEVVAIDEGEAVAAIVSPQTRRAAERLLASLNFESVDPADFLEEGAPEADDGTTGPMGGRAAPSRDEDSLGSDDGAYGATADSPGEGDDEADGGDDDGRPRRRGGSAPPSSSSSDDGPDLESPPAGETTSLLGRGDDADEEDALPETENEHLLRPSIFTTLGKAKKGE